MKTQIAIFKYYWSLGWDNSEGEEAKRKEGIRKVLLRQRIGDDAFNEWYRDPRPNWLCTLVCVLLNPLPWALLCAVALYTMSLWVSP